MSRPGAVALVLLLCVGGLALPAHSQEEEEQESRRWPHFEAEHLIAPPPSARDFGHDVDTDGQRIIVAARDAAYLYARDTGRGGWTRIATLEPSGGAVRSVSLGDGHAAVGSEGTVDLWQADADGDWAHRLTLTRDDPFGEDVLLRGGLLFVSSPRADTVGDLGRGGAVHVHRLGGSYSESQVLREPSGTVQRVFGADLDLQGDLLVVGSPARMLTEQVAPGAAYVYQRSGNTFSADGSMVADRGGDADSSFGRRVATTGSMVLVSASSGAYGGDPDGSGWVSFHEKRDGAWRVVMEESSDTTAVAAREDAALAVDWWWSVVRVFQREGEQLDCWRGPWCAVGILGGWERYFADNPFPSVLAMEGRVAVLGAPREAVDGQRSGLVLAYYDNALPRAVGLPREPVQDVDGDGREPVTLDASHSFDPDGEIVHYAWWQGARLLAEEPFVDLDLPLGTHAYRLEVTDDLGGVGEAQVRVVVREPQLNVHIHYCCEFISFNGGGLRPDQPSFFWSEVEDHRAGVKHWDWDFDGDGTSDSTEAGPMHKFPHGGDWDVKLTITNEAGDVLHAHETVHVMNSAPTADAGMPQVVTVDTTGLATATLDAGGSSDPDGEVARYDWMRYDHVTEAYINRPVASGEEAEVQVQRGVNPFLLRVTDDRGATSHAETTVIAIGAGQNRTGVPPDIDFRVTDVGDRRLFLEDLSGGGDAEVVARVWSVGETEEVGEREHVLAIDGPGRHRVTLKIFDADGRTQTRSQTVTVGDDPPTLYAWPMEGTVPAGAHVLFRARADDEAPESLSWRWRIDGRDYSDHQDMGRTFQEVGNHSISLHVTDDTGHTATLEGWMDVIPEEEFRQRFGDEALNGTAEGNLTGVFEEPDEALREELERERGPTDRDDAAADEEDAEEESSPEPLAATAPRIPGGPSLLTWVFTGIGALLVLLVAVEVERQRRRRARRRERYEAAMRSRLARRRAASRRR